MTSSGALILGMRNFLPKTKMTEFATRHVIQPESLRDSNPWAVIELEIDPNKLPGCHVSLLVTGV